MPVSLLELLQVSRQQACQLLEQLQIPGWTEYQSSLQAALSHNYQALGSSCQLLYLTCRPILLLIYFILYQVLFVVWKYVVVQGLYEHGLSQTRDGLMSFWQFQRSLTREQLMGEIVVLLCSVGVYKAWQKWRRQTYYRRFVVWYDHKQRQIIKVSFSRTFVSYV